MVMNIEQRGKFGISILNILALVDRWGGKNEFPKHVQEDKVNAFSRAKFLCINT